MTASTIILQRLHKTTEIKLILAFTVVIWSLYFVIRTLLSHLRGEELMLWIFIAFAIVGTLLTWLIARKLKNLPLLLIFIFGPPIALFSEIIAIESMSYVFEGKFNWQHDDFSWPSYISSTFWASYLYLTWYLGYFAIVYHYKFIRESLAAAEARAQANEAQLEMLRYQINPHFLFNTLNSISALVLDHKNERAENMIGGLSRFLRFSLDRVPNVLLPLEDEIAVIKEYLAIEEIRFSHKLSVKYDIDADTLDCLVPSLILQPAIENAIKHGIAPLKSDGKIRVRAKVIGNKLSFCVADSGRGVSTPTTLGVGMKNMQERIKALYGSKGHISLKTDPELGGALACIEIPIQRNQDDKEASIDD